MMTKFEKPFQTPPLPAYGAVVTMTPPVPWHRALSMAFSSVWSIITLVALGVVSRSARDKKN